MKIPGWKFLAVYDKKMEKVNRLTGRDLFVDEGTDAKIHPFNNLIQKTPEEWEEMGIFYRYGRYVHRGFVRG